MVIFTFMTRSADCFWSKPMIRVPALLLALGLGAPGMLHAAGSQNTSSSTTRPVYGALDATQINQIQGVSRAVLAAKGSQQSSAEEQALLNELHNLSASVNQALQFTPPTSLSLSVSGTASAEASTTVQPGNAGSARQSQLAVLLNPALDRLSQRRQQIDAMSSNDEATQTQIVHLQRLSMQAGLLEQAVRAALSVADDAGRYAQLAQIKQRLRSRSLQEWWQDQEAQALAAGNPSPIPATTPTLTTLTKHRPGLDDLHSGKH
jgi:hypothetical protein